MFQLSTFPVSAFPKYPLMKVDEAIEVLSAAVVDPPIGLPEEVFLFISRLTPMINVDLLIQDERKRTLLTWRDDERLGPGWHVPGGIIRFKEEIQLRVKAVPKMNWERRWNSNPRPSPSIRSSCRSRCKEHTSFYCYSVVR